MSNTLPIPAHDNERSAPEAAPASGRGEIERLSAELERERKARARLEREYRISYESAGVGIGLYTREGIVLSCNRIAAGFMGGEPGDFTGRSIAETLQKSEGDILLGRIESALANDAPTHLEYRVELPGRTVWLHCILKRIEDSDGAVAGVQIISTDISARKRMEEELRQSAEKFSKVFSLSPCALSIHENGSGSRILDCNQAFETLTGYTRKEIIGSDSGALGLYADPDVRRRLIEEMMAHGSVRNIEFRYRRKDGTIGWALQSVEPIELDGKMRAIAVSQEITDRKFVEVEKEKQNDELETRIAAKTRELVDLYDNAPCGYHSLDGTGLFVRINETELRWLGYRREEVLGLLRFTDILTEPSRKVFEANFPGFLERGWEKDLEFDLNRKDGSILPVVLNATAVRSASGEFLHSRSTIIDNTDRKRADEVARKSLLAIEAANRELEAFSYSVSHDLRAPLRAMDGFSARLLSEYASSLDDEGRRLLAVISRNAKRMGDLITDLLEFSRVGRHELQMRRLDMRSMAESAYRELLPGEDEEKSEFIISDIPQVLGDSALVRQVWINLIGNAIKFTSRKPRRLIEISARAEGDEIEYIIGDNGAGFDMEYSGKLFGVFQRLHTVREFEGTGIGLSIVKRIMERLDGRVWAEGRVDEGAVFHFTLPRAREARQDGGES